MLIAGMPDLFYPWPLVLGGSLVAAALAVVVVWLVRKLWPPRFRGRTGRGLSSAVVIGVALATAWLVWVRLEPWYYIHEIENFEGRANDVYPQFAEDGLVRLG